MALMGHLRGKSLGGRYGTARHIFEAFRKGWRKGWLLERGGLRFLVFAPSTRGRKKKKLVVLVLVHCVRQVPCGGASDIWGRCYVYPVMSTNSDRTSRLGCILSDQHRSPSARVAIVMRLRCGSR
eukprot:scaffold143994_cov28-Prasinocladus_malaysianus.AAC.1